MFTPSTLVFNVSSSYFQHLLNSFIIMVSILMVFFTLIVLFSMLYVLMYHSVSHFMGHFKANAEVFAFAFSVLALVVMGYPSMSLLYSFSSQTHIGLIVKVVASQWYWSFEVSNLMEDAIPMYMSPLEDLNVGNERFLVVDNILVIPTGLLVQFNITSSDVIHSFALPTLGAKVDATAGLLTVVPVSTSKIGVHYGQCSEICGMNHSFMPFVLEVSTMTSFLHWCMML